MRLVHVADLHLGCRQYDRLDGNGRNIREVDVRNTFRAFVDQTIEIAPDLIVLAGDIMHAVRPSNTVVTETFAEFRRLTEALPRTPVVMVAGNHDAPRSDETGCILRLFSQLGIHVIDRQAERLQFPEIGVSVLAVPDVFNVKRPALVPEGDARYHVLLLHGEVKGMPGMEHVDRDERASLEIPVDDIAPARWNYVALGHYHVHHLLAPNMAYAGSIDYTSTNPWGELKQEAARKVSGKGFVERNLATGEHIFHPLPRSRDYIDLSLSAEGMTGSELTEALRDLLDDAWPDDAVARVVVTECDTAVSREVDQTLLRQYKRRALNLLVNFRKSDVVRVGGASSLFGPRPSLEEMLTERLARGFSERPSAGVSLEAVTALGTAYLAQAKAMAEDSTLEEKQRLAS